MAAKKKAASAPAAKPARAKRAAKPVVELAPANDVAVEAVAAPEALADVAELAEAAPEIGIASEAESRPAITRKGKTSRYLLPANMEIPALGPVHADLLALEAGNDGPFVLDGANLSVIDTAGLQLLISFVSAVQSSGKKVSWDNYSVQAYQLASELGLVEALGD